MSIWPHRTLSTIIPALMLAATVSAWASPQSEAIVGEGVPEIERGSDTDALREQSIYIPYEKLREVFEREGRGVFLPYDQFQALWQAAREHRVPPGPDPAPPLGALITETFNDATVAQDVVEVRSTVRIEMLKPGWNVVPLRLMDAAIMRATIDEAPARIVYDSQAGYQLLYHHPEEEPAAVELELEFAKAIVRSPGRNAVSFQAPQAPISRWRVTIPEEGVKINLQPLIAATEMPAADPTASSTQVLAFVGAASEVQIDWIPRSEGARGLAALVSVRSRQQVRIEEGVVRVRCDLAYEVSRSELDRLSLLIPQDYRVVNVADANLRRWSFAPAPTAATGGAQRIDIELFQPAQQSQSLQLVLERIVAEGEDTTRDVPIIQALDVSRQQGVVVVDIDSGLRAEVIDDSGLVQIDEQELPADLREQGFEFAFRYALLPARLRVRIDLLEPTITGSALLLVRLQPEELQLDAFLRYTVEEAGVFQLVMTVPPAYEIRAVRGESVSGAAPVVVEGFRRDPQEPGRLLVSLSKKALGTVGLHLQLIRTLDAPELATPLGRSVEIPVPLPRFAAVLRQQGAVLVLAPESLRVSAVRSVNLRDVSVDEALQLIGTQEIPGAAGSERSSLSFIFGDEPVDLVLGAERRQPYVTVRQLLLSAVEPGVVRYDATFFLDVRYSGVRFLRLDVPADLASLIRIVTPGLREERIEPPPDDLGPGDVAWRLTGDRELLGTSQIKLTWERQLEALEVGKSVQIPIPVLMPRGVDRSWGQIVLLKAESLDLQPAEARAGRASHRSAARPHGRGGDSRRGPRVRVPGAVVVDASRHALPARRGQAHEHRAGLGPHGRDAKRSDCGPGPLPHARCSAAAPGRASSESILRHAAASDRWQGRHARERRSGRVLRSAAGTGTRAVVPAGAAVHASRRCRAARPARLS